MFDSYAEVAFARRYRIVIAFAKLLKRHLELMLKDFSINYDLRYRIF